MDITEIHDNIEEMTYESAIAALEETVELMNSNSVPLSELVALYEKGSRLVNRCMTLLNEYDGRIEKAMRSIKTSEEENE